MATTASKPKSAKTAAREAASNSPKNAKRSGGTTKRSGGTRRSGASSSSNGSAGATKPSRGTGKSRSGGSGADKSRTGASGAGKSGVAKAKTAAKRTSGKLKPGKPSPKAKLARTVAKKTLKMVGRRAVRAGAEALRRASETAVSRSQEAVERGMARVSDRRPPIQASVDVAAPILVVWSEWMKFEDFTEGLHRIEDIERDGDHLVGRIAAPHSSDWRAEIVDEREQEAFAWRSVEGTDCAGLVTFHRLSDRLTRVEADLDVLPTNPAQALLLSLPTPTRRAQRTLQRFKAKVEFINPDVYEADVEEANQQDNDGGDEPAGDD